MKAFDRQPAPPFWAEYVHRFLDLLARGDKPTRKKLHRWREQKRALVDWFHDTVRPAGEGALCAYCDGLLGGTSPRSIDHWVPYARCRALTLWWANLFPACYGCQMAKGSKWSVSWIRPDLDPVEAWIECDPGTAMIVPAPTVRDPALLRRINDTIDALGLNRPGLIRERRTALRSQFTNSAERALERAGEGPYRFLVARSSPG